MTGDDNWWQRSTSNLDPLWATRSWLMRLWLVGPFCIGQCFDQSFPPRSRYLVLAASFRANWKFPANCSRQSSQGGQIQSSDFPFLEEECTLFFFRQKILRVNIWDRWCDVGCCQGPPGCWARVCMPHGWAVRRVVAPCVTLCAAAPETCRVDLGVSHHSR